MKTFLTILTIILFYSCGPSAEKLQALKTQAKYHVGDEVYIKPDSTKAVILKADFHRINGCGCGSDTSDFEIQYDVRTSKVSSERISEKLIY